ncbi:MAG: hypothetical protein O3C05_02920, partial [Proteobacteria bacterium]|nr:hypothetical protein [Pseudomonadota bacterium]
GSKFHYLEGTIKSQILDVLEYSMQSAREVITLDNSKVALSNIKEAISAFLYAVLDTLKEWKQGLKAGSSKNLENAKTPIKVAGVIIKETYSAIKENAKHKVIDITLGKEFRQDVSRVAAQAPNIDDSALKNISDAIGVTNKSLFDRIKNEINNLSAELKGKKEEINKNNAGERKSFSQKMNDMLDLKGLPNTRSTTSLGDFKSQKEEKIKKEVVSFVKQINENKGKGGGRGM